MEGNLYGKSIIKKKEKKKRVGGFRRVYELGWELREGRAGFGWGGSSVCLWAGDEGVGG